MRIQTYNPKSSSKGGFLFPYNSQTYSDKSQKNQKEMPVPISWSYFTVGDPLLKSSRDLVIQGHLSGTNKETDYRDLHKQFHESQIKEFYFSDDKFMIVMPKGLERTYEGTRINFIDYAGNMISPINVLFDKTNLSSRYENDTKTNDGNVPCPILAMELDVVSGNSYSVTDSQGNGLSFTASKTGKLLVDLIYLYITGNNFGMIRYQYARYQSDGSEEIVTVANPASGDIFPRLNPGASAYSDISVTTFASSDVTLYYTDAYSGD